MSRSYRKQPIWKDHNKGMKRYANHSVRRALNRDLEMRLPYKSYKKLFLSYNICDYCWLIDSNFENYYKREIKLWNDFQHRFTSSPNKKEVYIRWITKYRGK